MAERKGPHRRPPRLHRHRCDRCRLVWEHGDGNRDNVEAHRCPGCGQLCEEWYAGPMSRLIPVHAE
jgi:hypothetical protein